MDPYDTLGLSWYGPTAICNVYEYGKKFIDLYFEFIKAIRAI